MTEHPITGGCQCGAVRYVAARLGRASICHCRMCQRATGNAFAPLVKAHVELQGTPARWQSSNIAERGFCANCGTPLFLRDIDRPADKFEIMIATLDDPDQVEIAHHYGVESQRAWLHLGDGLPRIETQPGGPSGQGPETIISYQDPAALAAKEGR